MDQFEKLLETAWLSVERFVRFRIPSKADADDLLQEVYLTAYQKFAGLKDKDAFKAWLISIARNKCNDYFRNMQARYEIPLCDVENELSDSRYGVASVVAVSETMELLSDKDKQILYLYFWKQLPQSEIAKKLDLPVGTVKSRLYTAKQNFKVKYPYHIDSAKGENNMKKLPEFIPEYKIEASTLPPFSVKWEELMGWFLIPKLGEKLSWGMYDIPSRKCSFVYDMEVLGKAKVHGIEGVELTAKETAYADKTERIGRSFVAQLTDTHCRYLATLRNDGEIRNYITFLDGDEFLLNWGFGDENCGNETNLTVKGDIRRNGNTVTTENKDFLLDIVGRYTVTIGSKSYDTICVMNVEAYNCGVISEQFLDKDGKTVLWRRYNRDDWAIDHYKRKWSEQLPDNDRLVVNGIIYVHWYDCITDYIL